jgi:hypothetical protein
VRSEQVRKTSGYWVDDDGHRARPIAFIDWDLAAQRLVETVLWWQNRCWRGIEAGAAAGDVGMVKLRDSGAVRSVRKAYEWVAQHRDELDEAPTSQ